MSVLKLKEILWEITPKCDKGCFYCGSKDILKKKPLSDSDLIKIAKQIGDSGVEEVTITGGEPGTLTSELLDKIVCIFHDRDVKIKAVTYGKLADEHVISGFDIIGFSINSLDDTEYITNLDFDPADHTMITNFGKHNVWDFDELAEYSKSFKCWQIQLTMGEYMLNSEGIKHLRTKISDCDAPDCGTVIVLADNLQVCHRCMAGVNSCSITYDGDVIACLSERSYGTPKSYGNLFKDNLKDIWENEFKDIRFKDCRKCCRDYVAYPEIDEESLKDENERKALPPTIIIEKIKDWPWSPGNPGGPGGSQVVLYGVQNPGGIQIYAVQNPHDCDNPSLQMYAVYDSSSLGYRYRDDDDNDDNTFSS